MNDQTTKFINAYLEIINEQYHRKPITGWSKGYFEKIMVKMLTKGMTKGLFKGKLAKQFDDFFVDKSVFSFKDVFTKPFVSTSGSGKKLHVILQYNYHDGDKIKKLLIGEEQAQQSTQKEGKIKKFFRKLKKTNKQGIIYNRDFLKKFKEDFKVSESAPQEEDEGEDLSQDQDADDKDQSVKTEEVKKQPISIITEDANDNAAIEEIKEKINNASKDNCLLSVFLYFNTLKHVSTLKKKTEKQYLNPNRVESYSGQIILKFNIDGFESTIPVSNSEGITWNQYRTANMDPPTPIGSELNEIWRNPQNSIGLVGLAAKKIGSRSKRWSIWFINV